VISPGPKPGGTKTITSLTRLKAYPELSGAARVRFGGFKTVPKPVALPYQCPDPRETMLLGPVKTVQWDTIYGGGWTIGIGKAHGSSWARPRNAYVSVLFHG
jgi:hypothetical protein